MPLLEDPRIDGYDRGVHSSLIFPLDHNQNKYMKTPNVSYLHPRTPLIVLLNIPKLKHAHPVPLRLRNRILHLPIYRRV